MKRDRTAAPVSLLLLAVVAVAILSSVGGASAARHRTVRRPPIPPGLGNPHVKANIRAFRHRQARLRSAASKRRRARSRTLYRHVVRAEARNVDRGHFHSAFDSPVYRGVNLRAGERVRKYTSDRTALVDNAAGRRGLAVSTLPLLTPDGNGAKVPVDLSLEDHGGSLEPAAALVPTRISKAATGGFSLPSLGMTVRPAGAAGSEAALTGGKAFYPNVLTDTDMLSRPTATGVESYSFLRSAASPEAITFSLSLPEGAQLRLLYAPSGLPAGAAVSRAGKDVLEIPPAVAYDSDGQPVPVSYSVAGPKLTVNVPHRSGSYRYPVLVDPDFKVTEQFSNHSGWQSISVGGPYAAGSGSYLYQSPVPNYGWRSGLIVQANTGTYQLNSYGNLYYTAPPNSFIYRGEFQFVTYGWLYQAVNQGLWRPDGQPEISRQTGTNMDNNYLTQCAPGPYPTCDPNNGTDNNSFVLGLQNIYLSNTYYNTTSAVTMQSALIYEHDRNYPQVTNLSQNASGWIDSRALSATATGSDPGLGMKEFAWVQPDRSQITSTHSCSGAYGNRCPSSWSATFNYNSDSLAEGTSTFGVAARDVVSNGSPETQWQVKVDRSKPSAPSLGGTLWTHRNQTADHRDEGLYAPTYTLNASAGDSRSGLKSIEVQVDTNPPYRYTASCSGTDGCSDSIPPWTFNSDSYSDGDHTITVTAKDQLADQAGVDNTRHVSSTSFQVTVDRRGDIYSAAEYDGNPQSGAAKLSDEWARAATRDARSTDRDFVATRGTAPCNASQPTGAQCGEVRTKSRFSEPPSSTTGDSWVIYRGTSPSDPNLDSVAHLQQPSSSNLGTPTSTGAINAAAQPWQILPPDHGTLYAYYESTYQEDLNSDGTKEQIIGRLWIDATTKFPIHMESQISGGAVTDERYFIYAKGRSTSAEVPADLFLASPPRLIDESKTVTFTGDASQSQQTDAETGAPFTPYYLGAAPTLTAGAFCLSTADIVKEGALPADEDEAPADPEGAPNLNGAITYTRAIYDSQGAGATCSPGTGKFDTPPLSVQSIAGSSSYAAAIRDQYQETGLYIEATPTDEDYLRSGVRAPLLGLTPVVTYIIKVDDQLSSAQMDINGTSVVITGPFDKNNIGEVVSQLRTR